MIEELKKILLKKGDSRKKLIRNFQNYIWNNELLPYNDEVIELLRTLAYDLDFCESEERVEDEIGAAIEKLRELESH